MAHNISGHSMDTLSPMTPVASRNDYPFPRSASGGRYAPRKHSAASSISSVGGTLDIASHWHGLAETSHNAISTLLQPPIVRTGLLPHTSAPASSAQRQPTARDIPPVTLTNIPSVDSAEFSSYLSQVGALYDSLQRAKENEDDGGTHLIRKGSRADDFSDLIDRGHQSPSRGSPSRKASLASLASIIESPATKRRSSGGIGRRTPQIPTPLSTIPNVYFDEDFHLENPRTFDVVSERSEVVRPAVGTPDERQVPNASPIGPRKALATNAILQEKLSWYMDTIEVHLVNSISAASTSFFAALGSLRELHQEAADSVEWVKMLRKELNALDQEMAIGGLDIVTKKRRRENLKQLSAAVHQLKFITESVARCESLVDSGEVEKALDAIDSLEKIIAGENDGENKEMQIRDLRGAAALRGVSTDLDALRHRIGRKFETKFVGALLADLRNHVNSVSKEATLQRWSNAFQRSRGSHKREPSAYAAYLILGEDFRNDMLSDLVYLHRARHTGPATTAYREAVLKEVRGIIRRPLPASNDDDADSMMSASTMGMNKQKTQQEKSSALARNLRALDPEDAEELLRNTYVGIGETLRRVATQVKILLDVTSTLDDPSAGVKSPARSPDGRALDSRSNQDSTKISQGQEIQEQIHQTLDMSNLLGEAVDIAQDKIVRVLRVRSEQSKNLPVESFLRYFTLNLLFANECEAVSGRTGIALKTVVNGHIKDFVQQMGESARQRLATSMEADPWNAKDFTDVDKEVLDTILSASTRDPEAWMSGSKVWLPPSFATKVSNDNLKLPASQTNGTSGTSTPSSRPTTRPAHVDSESFLLPASAIDCLHGLSSFLYFATGIPSMTTEIATSILSYLTLFNSRCTQLILGAGATRSAGLKNITTKHLALAAQAVNFISTLIPHIREFLRRHAGSGVAVSTLMGEFDRLRRSYLEHQQSIFDKLVEIMAGRAAAHAKSMKLVDWEDEDNAVVNPYMETLAKETGTLHRVLSKHLPGVTVRGIMEPIFRNYKDQWGKAYEEVELASEGGQRRMLVDAEYFRSKIGSLEGAGDTGSFLVNLVKGKPIPRARAVSPIPPVVAEIPETVSEKREPNGNDEAKAAAGGDDVSKTILEKMESGNG